MTEITRRNFLSTATLAGVTLSCGGGLQKSLAEETKKKIYKTQLYSAYACRMENVHDVAEKAAKSGYHGIELGAWDITPVQAREVRNIVESHGLRIHSVVRAWSNLLQPGAFDGIVESVIKALKTAQICGADAVLWVPCLVNAPRISPENFDIEFNPATCEVKRVVKGDNAPFSEYIKLQNTANAVTVKAVEKLIPVAAYEGVILGLENVWNQLWVKPNLAAAYIKQFDNPWIKSYLDLGNNCKYSPAEEWLRIMGRSCITKIHLKDFEVKRGAPNGGAFLPIGNGSTNWVSVRNVIEEIGFNGWVTIEDVKHYSMEEHREILKGFFDGVLTKEYANRVKKFG